MRFFRVSDYCRILKDVSKSYDILRVMHDKLYNLHEKIRIIGLSSGCRNDQVVSSKSALNMSVVGSSSVYFINLFSSCVKCLQTASPKLVSVIAYSGYYLQLYETYLHHNWL